VVAIPRLNHLRAEALLHAGWQPQLDRHFRFFKRDAVTASATIHAPLVPRPDARILALPYEAGRAIVHFNFLDFADLVDKVNRYTTVEAQQAYERGERARGGDLFRPIRPFLWRYVRTGGYRDGWRGLYLALIMAFYTALKYAKLREVAEAGSRARIEAAQAAVAERWLAAYDGEVS
jgi:hypothetical protein